MIFSMAMLFLILLSASCVIYYFYVFFIPALKLKNKSYNETLATDISLDEEDFSVSSAPAAEVFEPAREKKANAFFDSVYRSKIQDEHVCIGFCDGENGENLDSDDEKVQKKSLKQGKGFKFWISCYKLLAKQK